MSKRTAASALENMREMARKAFERHVITERAEGRWLIQRIHEDGRPESTYAADIIETRRGLYVGGDIYPIVFASNVWTIGNCMDLAYYVASKATQGMGGDKLTKRWDREVAESELREYIAERIKERAEDGDSFDVDEDALETAFGADSQHEFYCAAVEALGDSDSWEVVGDMGEVTDARVVYAHAAVARLCVLLKEQEKAEASNG